MKNIAVSLNITDISVSMKPSQGLNIIPPSIINTVLGIKANTLTEDRVMNIISLLLLESCNNWFKLSIFPFNKANLNNIYSSIAQRVNIDNLTIFLILKTSYNIIYKYHSIEGILNKYVRKY